MIRLSSILRDTRGNAFVEMGFILPIFATLLVLTVDMSRAYAAKLQLQQAAQRSIEWVQVRDYVPTDLAKVKTEAATGAGVAESAVTVNNWLECNAVRQSSYTGTCNAGESMKRFVSVTITKPFTPTFGTKFFPGASGGHVTLNSTAGVRVQ